MSIFRLRDEKKDHYWEEELGKCTAIIKGRMMKKGSMMISYQPLGEYPNFFRSIISNQVKIIKKKKKKYILLPNLLFNP